MGSAILDSSIRAGTVGNTGSWTTFGIRNSATGSVLIAPTTIANHLTNGTGSSGQCVGISSSSRGSTITREHDR
ncbi:MAG: hypothetical protein MZU79_01040 [Anaerotruncus sp.]|nr:hypothetical protein [Anaerotruncus sp.]